MYFWAFFTKPIAIRNLLAPALLGDFRIEENVLGASAYLKNTGVDLVESFSDNILQL